MQIEIMPPQYALQNTEEENLSEVKDGRK